MGEFKTNFDGAMFEENDNAEIGIIVRNSRGKVMAALSEKIPKPSLVEMLEMLATRRAVKFVQEIGLHDPIFEGDSLVGIKALQRGNMLSSSFGHLISNTSSFVSSLRSFSFSHTLRQGNVVAHALT